MGAHLGKIALMVAMTHGFRTLGRMASPRWTGLALGLPCSTAVALVGCGADSGVDYAVAMSRTSLIGLAGAVALPMAYARAIHRGWRLHWAILIGIAAYLTITLAAGRLLPGEGNACLGIAALAVGSAVWRAGRMSADEASDLPEYPGPRRPNPWLRTAVPIACLLASLEIGEAFGPEIAGLMSTFPGVTMTVICLTHLESGPSSAIRMVRALPAGNLGMVAFLAAFRFGCPVFGLAWGTVSGYVAALTILVLVVTFDGLWKPVLARLQLWRTRALEWSRRGSEPDPRTRPTWPRESRRFSPLIEPFAY
jgi:hypothetical protein